MKSGRLTREAALSFLLTHLVVERQYAFEMNANNLFRLITLAGEAEHRVNTEEGIIPHEIIESIASEFMDGSAP